MNEEEKLIDNNKNNMLIDEYDNEEEKDEEMKCYKTKENGSATHKDHTYSDVKIKDCNKKIKANSSNGENKHEELHVNEREKCKVMQETVL